MPEARCRPADRPPAAPWLAGSRCLPSSSGGPWVSVCGAKLSMHGALKSLSRWPPASDPQRSFSEVQMLQAPRSRLEATLPCGLQLSGLTADKAFRRGIRQIMDMTSGSLYAVRRRIINGFVALGSKRPKIQRSGRCRNLIRPQYWRPMLASEIPLLDKMRGCVSGRALIYLSAWA
jgi:hypothetical protein